MPGQPGPVYPPGQFSDWNRPSVRATWLGLDRPVGSSWDGEAEPVYSVLATSDPSADQTTTQTWAAIDDAGGWSPPEPRRDLSSHTDGNGFAAIRQPGGRRGGQPAPAPPWESGGLPAIDPSVTGPFATRPPGTGPSGTGPATGPFATRPSGTGPSASVPPAGPPRAARPQPPPPRAPWYARTRAPRAPAPRVHRPRSSAPPPATPPIHRSSRAVTPVPTRSRESVPDSSPRASTPASTTRS